MNIVFHILTDNPDREANARRTIKTAEVLAEFGHTVYVISNFPDFVNEKRRKHWLFSFKKEFVKNGVNHLQYFCIPFCFGGLIRRLAHYYSFNFSSRFAKLPKGVKADIIVATEPPLFSCKSAARLAKKFKAKLVFDIQDIWPQVGIEIGALKENSFKCRRIQSIANYMYKKSDFVITVTNRKVEHLKKLMAPYHKEAQYVPNATDLSFIQQEIDHDFLKKYQFNKYFSVVHVGKVGKAQDLDSLLDIAKLYLNTNNIRFFLLGDGVTIPHILDRIEKEHISNVIYCGTCTQAQCYTALVNSKLAYVSLVNKNLQDSVPTKIAESLICGCPIILSASGESAEVVLASKYGLVSQPGDFDTLSKNFDEIYKHYDTISVNKDYAIKYVMENFERKTVTKKLEKMFFELLDNKTK